MMSKSVLLRCNKASICEQADGCEHVDSHEPMGDECKGACPGFGWDYNEYGHNLGDALCVPESRMAASSIFWSVLCQGGKEAKEAGLLDKWYNWTPLQSYLATTQASTHMWSTY